MKYRAILNKRSYSQNEEEGWNGHDDFDEALNAKINPTTIISRNCAKDDPDGDVNRHSEKTNRQRNSRSVNHTTEYVPSRAVGTKPVPAADPLPYFIEIDVAV